MSARIALGLAAAGLAVALGTGGAAGETRTTLVTVTAGKPSEFTFTLSRSSGLPVGPVAFKVTNRGTLVHGFKVCTQPLEDELLDACTGKAVKALRPGRSVTLSVTFTHSGTYEYLSTVAGQAAQGMKGLLGVGVKLPKASATKPTAPATAAPSPSPSPSPAPSGDTVAGAALWDSLGCSNCHSVSEVQAAGTVSASLNATHTGGPFPNGPLTAAQIDALAKFVNR